MSAFCAGALAACAHRGASGDPPARAPAEPAASARGSGTPLAASADAPAPGPGAVREIPRACAAEGPDCFLPDAYVEAVCKGKYPELALVLFSKSMPWHHAYLKAEWLQPTNVYGGEQSERWMQFGEEVLVMRRRSNSATGGVQVSGPTDLDVLRWDGTCATVRREMLVDYVTGPNKSARVVFKYLEQSFQDALVTNEGVKRAAEAEHKVCHGGNVAHPSDECDKAMLKLTDAVALAVKTGLELPAPSNAPEWKRP